MLNNLTNFFSILAKKRYKSTPEDTDLVALGTKDRTFEGGYKPVATRLEDLKSYFGGGGGSWDLLRTAVIDPQTGDDATGTIGDGNLPYKTIAAATSAGATNFYLLPGTYTETVTVASNHTYYSAQGVLFTGGGIASPAGAGQISNWKWYGNANFIGDFRAFYLVNNDVYYTDLVFEFDTIRTTGGNSIDLYIWASLSQDAESTVTIIGNEIDSYSANANVIGPYGNISGTINIRKKLSGFYSLIASSGLGKLTINCPNMVLKDGGFAGNNGAYKQLFVSYGVTGYEDITINGNFYSEVTGTLGSIAGVIVFHLGDSPPRLQFNGRAKADFLLYGVRMATRGGTVVVQGDMYLPNGRLFYQTQEENVVSFENGRSTVSVTSTTGAVTAGTGTKVYLKDYEILMTADTHIISMTSINSEIYTNDVNAEGVGASASSYFINTGGAPRQAGLKNTWSTQNLDPGFVNTYASGFVNEPLLKVNKII